MTKPALRVVTADGASNAVTARAVVPLRLGEVFPLLVHAHRHDYQWLGDLANDEVIVSADLADMLHRLQSWLSEKRPA